MGKNSKRAKALASFEQCEHDWINSLSKGTQEYYPILWYEFKEYVGMTGSEILKQRLADDRLSKDNPEHWRFERLALDFYRSLYQDRDPPIPTGTDKTKLVVAQSFFHYHRLPLVFRRGEIKEPIPTMKYYEFSLKDIEAMRRHGNAKERWIFLGGKSIGQRVKDFLRIKREDIEPLLNEIPPVPIDLVTSKKNIIAHPCLDADAIEAAKDYLATRTDENPFMLPSQNMADNKPMTGKAVAEAIKRVADIAHRADPSVLKYRERKEHLRFHKFRAFLTAGFQNAHVATELRKWMVGHKLSGTEKAYTSHQRVQAYKEAEAYLLLPRSEQLDQRLQEVENVLTPDVREKLKELGVSVVDQRTGRKLAKRKLKPEEIGKSAKRKERKIIPEDEVENHTNHGWEFVSVLPSGKILIEREIE